MQQLTEKQYKSLTKSIYDSLMGASLPCECGAESSLDMGDMGAANDEAERIVSKWMELNKLTLKED